MCVCETLLAGCGQVGSGGLVPVFPPEGLASGRERQGVDPLPTAPFVAGVYRYTRVNVCRVQQSFLSGAFRPLDRLTCVLHTLFHAAAALPAHPRGEQQHCGCTSIRDNDPYTGCVFAGSSLIPHACCSVAGHKGSPAPCLMLCMLQWSVCGKCPRLYVCDPCFCLVGV